jgi:hypothetical protein
MPRAVKIFVVVMAGILACGAAGLAGLAAALTDWNWYPAASDGPTALANETTPATSFEQEDAVSAAAFAEADHQSWYLTAPQRDTVDSFAAFQLRTTPLSESSWPSPHIPEKILGTGKVPTPPQRRSLGRPGSVLNDAQIASIKARLKLTPDQERMWPTVAAALRKISYAKEAMAHARSARDGDRITYIDFDGPEVQELKSVALPLIMSLSEDQKREVRALAHVMGLDGIAASF